jgi:hypothetical protein
MSLPLLVSINPKPLSVFRLIVPSGILHQLSKKPWKSPDIRAEPKSYQLTTRSAIGQPVAASSVSFTRANAANGRKQRGRPEQRAEEL